MSEAAALPALARSSGRRARAGAQAEAVAAWVLAWPAVALMWLMLLGPAVVVILLSSVNSSANFIPRRGSPRGSPSLGPSCKLTIALTCGHSFINALRAPHTPTIFLGSMLAIDVAANHTDGGRL